MFVRFKELREEKGITIEELSNAINVRPEIIKSIENGFNAPIHVLVLYAKYFEVTSDYLLELSDKKDGFLTFSQFLHK